MATMPLKIGMCIGLFLSASVLFGKQNNVDVHPECFIGSKVGSFKFKDDNTSELSAYISGLSDSPPVRGRPCRTRPQMARLNPTTFINITICYLYRN